MPRPGFERKSTAPTPDELRRRAWLKERAGDTAGAEVLYRQAVDLGNPDALQDLIRLQDRAGDAAGADRMWRFGLTGSGEVATRLDFD